MASTTTKTTVSKPSLKKQEKPFKHEYDFFDKFHKNGKLCTIPATTNKKSKQNAIVDMQPKLGIYADYNISQTDIKLDAGSTKIHLERTVAEYIPPSPGVDVPPPPITKKKKIKYFHGGPPVWEFIDEKRKKEVEAEQEFYKERLAKLLAKNKKVGGGKRRFKS